MGDKTGIQWTDATWNPVRGCRRVSPGCERCYAETMAGRFCGPGQPYEGLARRGPNGARWTGDVRLVLEHLDDPLRWRKTRRVFVNSMSDLFHEDLDMRDIARVWAVMLISSLHNRSPGHKFQVLTKRAANMQEVLTSQDFKASVMHQGAGMMEDGDGWWSLLLGYLRDHGPTHPNIWLGVSVEDQQRADDRIPLLLQTPAAVRFISAEPLLGEVDLRHIPAPPLNDEGRRHPFAHCDALNGMAIQSSDYQHDRFPSLDWVIVGGESGPGARRCDVEWVATLVRECSEASVPVFVKQLGAAPDGLRTKHPKGGDPDEWPVGLRVREFPA